MTRLLQPELPPTGLAETLLTLIRPWPKALTWS